MAKGATAKPTKPAANWVAFPRATLVGLVLLTVSAAMSVLLALDSLNAISLPGCGAGSGCARAAASAWGKIPGVGWPVSFVGLAYFGAMAAAWPMAGARLPGLLLMAARAGGVVSILYVVVAVVGSFVCPYCLVANGANLVFWLIAEWAYRKGHGAGLTWRQRTAVPVWAAVFIAATVGLAMAWSGVKERARDQSRKDVADFIDRVKQPATGDSADRMPTGLTGRYRRGPEKAAVRVVMFTDYQCTDCKRVEGELSALAAGHPEMSLAVRYFPLCPDCNKHMPQNMHPNACWAARAAETAGVLGGADGFWRMHRWLFEHGGSFTDEQIKAALPGLGFDAAAFLREMESPVRNGAIAEDVELGIALGLHFTPLVIVNGQEVRGWQVEGALTRAIEAVLAGRPPARGPEDDRPPLAVGKATEDWRNQPVIDLPRDATRPALGSVSKTPAHRVVVFGDLLEPGTGKVDQMVRGLIAGGADIAYEFRHFPLNNECNPAFPRVLFEQSCLAARAVDAAGLAGGSQSQRAAHEWMINNRDRLSEQALRDGAPALATDEAALFSAMANPLVAQRIAADIALAQRIGIGSQAAYEIPTVFVDGRWVPRLRLNEVDVLERVLKSPRP